MRPFSWHKIFSEVFCFRKQCPLLKEIHWVLLCLLWIQTSQECWPVRWVLSNSSGWLLSHMLAGENSRTKWNQLGGNCSHHHILFDSACGNLESFDLEFILNLITMRWFKLLPVVSGRWYEISHTFLGWSLGRVEDKTQGDKYRAGLKCDWFTRPAS